jgi:predicted CxxxxCH...CXXCH cytochrome family protein
MKREAVYKCTRHIITAHLALAILFLGSCKCEPLATGMVKEYQTDCGYCHGVNGKGAPPSALNGSRRTSDVGVGAHQTHLRKGKNSQAIECEQCHVVPRDVDDPHHLTEGQKNTNAEVVFGDIAQNAGLTPKWDRRQRQCSDVYCHGASLEGGNHVAPIWTQVDGSQIKCDGCHGNPPPWPHMQGERVSTCATCHPETVGPDGAIRVADGLHINGEVEAAVQCYSCHGNGDANAAPPQALDGSDQTSDIGVGAHQAHMLNNKVSKAISCEQCHIVPVTVGAPGHWPAGEEEAYAEVTFGDLAKTGGLIPAWDRDQQLCTNTYCHGASLTGANHVAPIWTRVDGSQIECDGCHGNPPPWPHLQGVQGNMCVTCHPKTVDANGDILLTYGFHINGKVDFGARCYACHGTTGVNQAPPSALNGSSRTSDIGVGAHQAHMQGKKFSKGISCDQCHVVPDCTDCHNGAQPTTPHYLAYTPDHPYADVVFGDLAKTGGLTPSWDRTGAQCVNTYCHGTSLKDGTLNKPTWTRADGTQVQCGSCHRAPPPPPHQQRDTCENCHPLTVIGDKTINLSSKTHINGRIDHL